MKTSTVLVLDGHTNQALACVRSLGSAGDRVLVASHRRSSLATWSRYCQGSFRLHAQNIDAFTSMREWAKREGVEIVLPLTERSCVLMNAERLEWENAKMIVGCGSEEMLDSAFDKGRTVEHAEQCGVSVPRTLFSNSLADCMAAVEEVGFPCVVKPRWSGCWDGTSFLSNRGPAYLDSDKDLKKVLTLRKQLGDWPLIQEFVPGQGKGIFALCDQGRIVALFAHERLRETRPSGSGSSLRRSVALDPRLREPAERLLTALEWHGPAMVEFKDDGKNPPRLMEINGRFWGSLQLGIDAGVDFPLLWVSILKGEPLPPVKEYEKGIALRWLWGDIRRFGWIVRGAPSGYVGEYPTVYQGIKELFAPQLPGTRLEAWRLRDPLPAIGELAEGAMEFFEWWETKRKVRRTRQEQRPVHSHPHEIFDLGETK